MKKQFALYVIFMHLSCGWVFAASFFSDDFESGDLSHVDPVSGASWSGSNSGSTDNVTVSSEQVHSGTHALKFFFAGNSDLNDDAWAEQRFNLGNKYDDVYIRFYIFFPNNYMLRDTGGAENTKLLLLWGDDYGDDMNKTAVEYEMDMKFGFKAKITGWPDFKTSCSGATGYARDYPRAATGIADIKGRWASVEIHNRRDTGLGDGIFQLWIDGKLEIDAQNIAWTGAPCGLNEFFRNGYLLGWSNAGFSQDTVVYVDDVVFSTSYIGVDGGVPPVDGGVPPVLPPAPPKGFIKN